MYKNEFINYLPTQTIDFFYLFTKSINFLTSLLFISIFIRKSPTNFGTQLLFLLLYNFLVIPKHSNHLHHEDYVNWAYPDHSFVGNSSVMCLYGSNGSGAPEHHKHKHQQQHREHHELGRKRQHEQLWRL